MINNLPSLSELLTAYNQPGAGAAINQGTQGVVLGMNIAAARQKAQLDQQNKQAELANQGITANAAQTSAQAAQQEAANKLVPVETAERYTGAAPGTFGAPGTMVPVSAANDYLTRTSQATQAGLTRQQIAATKALQLHQMDVDANLRAQQAKYATDKATEEKAQSSANVNLTNAAHQLESLPWYSSVLSSTPFYTTTATKTAQANYEHAKQQAENPQSVLGNTAAPKPTYSATATHADGSKIGYNPATNKWEPIQ